MPAKPKATKRPSIAAKAKAVAAMFGEPEPRETLDFCYRRRHLDIIELTDLDHAISTTLNRIRERDGVKIFNEVADHLITGLTDYARHVGASDRRGHRRTGASQRTH